MARSFDDRILISSLTVALPTLLAATVLLWLSPAPWWLRGLILAGLTLISVAAARAHRRRVTFPIYTLANVLEALREGDYSIRARRGEPTAALGDALGQALGEANLLATRLQEERRTALEATALLRRVMEEIEVAVFALDDDDRLRLANRAGERLLGRSLDQLAGASAHDIGLGPCLGADPLRPVAASFPGGEGRWEVRQRSFRQEGKPLRLLVISDLSRPLREEERQAWKRLIRVLGHELNNSLAPIKSMAGSLGTLLDRNPRPSDWQTDMRRGLDRIEARAESLSRFMSAYARLARLPPPNLEEIDLGQRVRRLASLEGRRQITVSAGPEVRLRADGAQLEQALLNLLANAVEAAETTGGAVTIGWQRAGDWAEVVVEDEGPGLSNPENLFVPFYTTKPEGSGIGLVLSRQIAEGHGGSLTLSDRHPGPGCAAVLRLPLEPRDGRATESSR
ncbi:MAG: ATP-binding protein [Acidobacteriota bacterium]